MILRSDLPNTGFFNSPIQDTERDFGFGLKGGGTGLWLVHENPKKLVESQARNRMHSSDERQYLLRSTYERQYLPCEIDENTLGAAANVPGPMPIGKQGSAAYARPPPGRLILVKAMIGFRENSTVADSMISRIHQGHVLGTAAFLTLPMAIFAPKGLAPLFAVAAVGAISVAVIRDRKLPRLPRRLAALLGVFAALCGVSALGQCLQTTRCQLFHPWR